MWRALGRLRFNTLPRPRPSPRTRPRPTLAVCPLIMSRTVATFPDRIHLAALQLPPQRFAQLTDLWARPAPQPVRIDLRIGTDLAATALTDGRDALAGTVNYGTASKAILALAPADGKEWEGVEQLAAAIARSLILEHGAPSLVLTLSLPRALLSTASFDHVSEWARERGSSEDIRCMQASYAVTDLALQVLLGLNPCERLEPQPITLKLRFDVDADATSHTFVPRPLVSDLARYLVRSTDYGTVEALSTDIARFCFTHPALALPPSIGRIAVRVDKPSAVALAASAGAEVVRSRDFFKSRPHSDRIPCYFDESHSRQADEREANGQQEKKSHTAFLSLGSNIGPRSAYITSALRLLRTVRRDASATGREQWVFESEQDEGAALCNVVDTSFMYETAPMYVTDQGRFLNAAVEISTTLPPLDLLDLTQTIEARLGRDHAASLARPKGPRVVDLDMLWHDGAYAHPDALPHPAASAAASGAPASILHTPRLTLPHIGLAEREFVLRPLADMRPRWRHPLSGRTVAEMLAALKPDPGMQRVLPVVRHSIAAAEGASSPPAEERLLPLAGRTHVMAIINTTPDSFSDGGAYRGEVQAAVDAAADVLVGPDPPAADIVDIGGMSTAPGRPDVDEAEEAVRVVPVVRALRERESPDAAWGIISVDTFRPSVARAALDAGANIVNDVTGARGTWSDDGDVEDPGRNELGDEMLRLVAARGVPIVLMHMRGTSRTMTSAAHTTYNALAAEEDNEDEDAAVVSAVRAELRICVARALRAGVPRWNIVLDPGIGFAKTREGSLALVRRVGDLTAPAFERADVRNDSDTATEPSQGPNLSLRNLPLLIGPSRKRFLAPTTAYRPAAGAAAASAAVPTEPSAKDRIFATAAACAAGVAGGVDFVRVHDVREMRDVVRTADAIWRPKRR